MHSGCLKAAEHSITCGLRFGFEFHQHCEVWTLNAFTEFAHRHALRPPPLASTGSLELRYCHRGFSFKVNSDSFYDKALNASCHHQIQGSKSCSTVPSVKLNMVFASTVVSASVFTVSSKWSIHASAQTLGHTLLTTQF